MPARKQPKRVYTAMYLEPYQKSGLTELSERTRLPQAALFREAIDDLFAKYKLKVARR